MTDYPDHDTRVRFTLGTLFATFSILGVLLSIPVFGVLLLSTILGLIVFLGLVIAIQFPIFILLRRSFRYNRVDAVPPRLGGGGVINHPACGSNMAESNFTWGCAAFGRSGEVFVHVNVTTARPARWELDIALPSFQLRFAIESSVAVIELHDFLTVGDADNLTIGLIAATPLTIIRDREFDDRFFLVLSTSDGAIHYSVAGEILTDLIAALADAVSDLSG